MKEIDPKQTSRAEAFSLWMQAPMPMVTLIKTLHVTNLVRFSRKHHCSFHVLMCWCIGRAAARTTAFHLLPVGQKLYFYDRLAINTVVHTKSGGITTCDVPFSPNLQTFARSYHRLTMRAAQQGFPFSLGDDYMVIGTSALPQCAIDGAVNIYAGIYNNPFLIWGRYRKGLRKTLLPISFQFHHVQMDGEEAAGFLTRLQQEINHLRS